ncbi:MAG: glycosyltransferase, partial [Candidatus Peribacteria bacterium]|nr:glycosyltransferase [Candidatus Peribacteria bacterium]
QPIISICIPTYRKTVKDALESIISQFNGTIEKKIEIIVGDDASPDTSIPIFMKELSQKYDNIKYIRYDQNR